MGKQDWLCILWSPGQNKNVVSLAQKLLRISRWQECEANHRAFLGSDSGGQNRLHTHEALQGRNETQVNNLISSAPKPTQNNLSPVMNYFLCQLDWAECTQIKHFWVCVCVFPDISVWISEIHKLPWQYAWASSSWVPQCNKRWRKEKFTPFSPCLSAWATASNFIFSSPQTGNYTISPPGFQAFGRT